MTFILENHMRKEKRENKLAPEIISSSYAIPFRSMGYRGGPAGPMGIAGWRDSSLGSLRKIGGRGKKTTHHLFYCILVWNVHVNKNLFHQPPHAHFMGYDMKTSKLPLPFRRETKAAARRIPYEPFMCLSFCPFNPLGSLYLLTFGYR